MRAAAAFASPARAPALPDRGVQSEWEWPLVVRRYADGAVTNEEGDRFAFRMVDAQGRPLHAESPRS